jgi:hypothetical protein
MLNCKMTYVIQGVPHSHCFHNVNLSNHGLSDVLKSVTS